MLPVPLKKLLNTVSTPSLREKIEAQMARCAKNPEELAKYDEVLTAHTQHEASRGVTRAKGQLTVWGFYLFAGFSLISFVLYGFDSNFFKNHPLYWEFLKGGWAAIGGYFFSEKSNKSNKVDDQKNGEDGTEPWHIQK